MTLSVGNNSAGERKLQQRKRKFPTLSILYLSLNLITATPVNDFNSLCYSSLTISKHVSEKAVISIIQLWQLQLHAVSPFPRPGQTTPPHLSKKSSIPISTLIPLSLDHVGDPLICLPTFPTCSKNPSYADRRYTCRSWKFCVDTVQPNNRHITAIQLYFVAREAICG